MVGVVMRSDWVIDGAALGSATVGDSMLPNQ
jgi:hypothetical protein